jgi:hypothetical protein
VACGLVRYTPWGAYYDSPTQYSVAWKYDHRAGVDLRLMEHISSSNGAAIGHGLHKAVASLEGRVAALEGQLQSANARTRQAETATPRPILASLNAVAPTYAPMQLGQSGKSLVEPPPEYVWSGLYWGTSFGYGSTSSKTRYRIRDRSTSTSSSSEFGEDSFSDTSRGVSQQTTTGESEGENDGALADLLLARSFGVSGIRAWPLTAGPPGQAVQDSRHLLTAQLQPSEAWRIPFRLRWRDPRIPPISKG